LKSVKFFAGAGLELSEGFSSFPFVLCSVIGGSKARLIACLVSSFFGLKRVRVAHLGDSDGFGSFRWWSRSRQKLGRDLPDERIGRAMLDGDAEQVVYSVVSVGPPDQLVYDLGEGTSANYRFERLVHVVRHKLSELREAECGHERFVEKPCLRTVQSHPIPPAIDV
jgi:hypothetical protein